MADYHIRCFSKINYMLEQNYMQLICPSHNYMKEFL